MNTQDWIVEFETRYSQKQREKLYIKKQQAEKRKDKAKTSKGRTNEFADIAIQNRKDEARMVKERLENGYVFGFEREVAGRVRKPFSETGLRSDKHPLLKLFVSRVPRGGKARASDNKADLYVPYKSKLLTMDCPYIETNKTVVGHIRIDIDGIFASPDHFKAELQKIVDDGGIPHLPHLATGDILEDGRYASPHVLFDLTPGSEVWINREDERCRQRPISLLDSVTRGLVKGLISIGADPDAPRLTQRMKNPLSPIWHVMILNDTQFMSLKEYASKLDLSKSWEELARRASVVQSKLGVKGSNKLFNETKEMAKQIAREWHFNADRRIKCGKEQFAQNLFDELEKHTRKMDVGAKEAAYVLEKVCGYISNHFDPSRLENTGKSRGAAMHKVEGIRTVSGRQKIGAQHAAEERNRKAAELAEVFLEAYDQASAIGKVSIEVVARSVGISRSAAYRALKERQPNCPPRCIDKKVLSDTPVMEETVEHDETEPTYEEPSMFSLDHYDVDVEACENVYISSPYQTHTACNMPADDTELIYRA